MTTTSRPRTLVIFGTRPEAIKLFPVVRALQQVDGMDVVTAIEGVPTDGRDKPIDAVRVESITIAE